MKIEILSLFPSLFEEFFRTSLIGKASHQSILTFSTLDIRSFAPPPHRSVDDAPYGGGAGMVMKPEPLAAAIEDAKSRLSNAKVILLSASGERFTQTIARSLAPLKELILVCGRYEGVDQRVIDLLIDRELSIGDYVLMGGEVAAMVVIEAVGRLIPGVIGNDASLIHESFSESQEGSFVEAPHYTRPQVFRGLEVPEALTSGDHQRIERWRIEEGKRRTSNRRPDLINSSKPKKS